MFEVRELLLANGISPYRRWLEKLDVATRARIQARIFQFEAGNLGDCKAVGHGVMESRLHFGPGWRIYFGRMGSDVVLLLGGSDKADQRRTIARVQGYWRQFKGGG